MKKVYDMLPFTLKRIHVYAHICIEYLWEDSNSSNRLGTEVNGIQLVSCFVFQFYAAIHMVSCLVVL